MSDGKRIVEDQRPETALEGRIRDALAFYAISHEYDGSPWDGIEKFHLHLSTAVDAVAIQSAEWHQYGGSEKEWNGKDWRLVSHDHQNAGRHVVVNCHSILHDGIWSLATTIYDTGELLDERLRFMGDTDPWRRSMQWSLRVLDELTADACDYDDEPRADMVRRMAWALAAGPLMRRVAETVEKAHEDLFEEPSELPDEITLAVNDWNLKDGKIGSYKYVGEFPFGVLTLGAKAFRKGVKMVYFVMAHELAHAAVGNGEDDDHGEKFQELAARLNIPEGYQD